MKYVSSAQHAHALEICRHAYRLQREGRVTDAIELYRQSLQLHPTPHAHLLLAWAYAAQRRYDDALTECLRAIELDPDYGNAYNDGGVYLLELRRFEEAEQWFQRAISARKTSVRHHAHYNLGRLYERQGRWLDAIREYYAALLLEPRYTRAALALLRLQAKLN